MPRRRPTISRAVATCWRALISVSHRVPLIGFVVGGALLWLAFVVRSRPPTSVELINQIAFWLIAAIAAAFLLFAAAGFIETVSGRRKQRAR